MINWSTYQKDITIINKYAPNIRALQCVRQMLTSMKGEINNNTIIVGDLNTPLTSMDRSTKQKISKETQTLNDAMDPENPLVSLSVQFSSVAQSCLNVCNPMNCSAPGLPVHHQLLKFTQIHVHRVSDAIQPSHPLSFPSPPAPNPSQHQSLFQWVSSSHEVAKVLEFQL